MSNHNSPPVAWRTKTLEHISIRTRLAVLLVFSVVSLWLLGSFSSWTILRVSSQATAFIDHEFEAVRVVGGVQTAISDARRFEKDVLLTMGDDQATERNTALWVAEMAKVHRGLTTLATLTQTDDAPGIAAMVRGIDGYELGFRQVLEQIAHGGLHDPWAANAAMTPVFSSLELTEQSLATLTHSIAGRANLQRQELVLAGRAAPWLVVGATALVSVAALLLVMAIVRSILVPVRALQAVASAWGSGDLREGMPQRGTDELSQVMRDMGLMQEQLCSLVTQVQSGVPTNNLKAFT